ncbi:hypothetical protein PXK00_04995 [Phaeobacter sp. QD34_3]|uniref:hypothetical protein n=1 Tax=unclassified Phaeobacter TaxID=2621772 RepID=UPI00237FCDD3|nr:MULTISPECIES: hypothetical protein [unclassified Phaeobacter]MDE4132455.1 hypothetical protein [Phaeobacter sp. QD34_3]MDE4136092.1 hypothetical protein [Phaeobacter sp. QD34_24]
MIGRKVLRSALAFAVTATVSTSFPQAGRAAAVQCPAPLTQGVPKRQGRAPRGSEVMQALQGLQGRQRDDLVMEQVLSGNLPPFLRKLVPVDIAGVLANGERMLVTICVMPEYLAVGDNRDFVRVPMGLASAARIASELGFLLPTPKMVDAIYNRAQIRLAPRPMKPTAQMESTDYLMRHDQIIDAQRAQSPSVLAALTSGQKKDIVLTNRLRSKPGRVAIYGWHRQNGRPIQPLSTVHGAEYADYSHGVRLVSQTAFVNGRPTSLAEIMADRELAGIVSSEGPIADATGLLATQF